MSEFISPYQPSRPEMGFLPIRAGGKAEIRLTSRRQDVLGYAAMGLSDSEIAHLMGITRPAVKMAYQVLRSGFEAESMTEVVLSAVERGIVDLNKATDGLDLSRLNSLTTGEKRILSVMADSGSKKKDAKEIADELDLSPATVKGVQSRINMKLGTNGCLQTRLLLMKAEREGLWPVPQTSA